LFVSPFVRIVGQILSKNKFVKIPHILHVLYMFGKFQFSFLFYKPVKALVLL
jgi:hypothetical protein